MNVGDMVGAITRFPSKLFNAKKNDDAENTSKTSNKQIMLLGIRNKIIICFVIPIIFMIIIGTSAYRKAAAGMTQKFKDSTLLAVQMASENVDLSSGTLQSEATKYLFDDQLSLLVQGMLEKQPLEKLNAMDAVSADMLAAKVSNPYIDNLHILTMPGMPIISTAGSGADGFLKDYMETVKAEKGIQPWIDSHPDLDAKMNLSEDTYLMSYEAMLKSRKGCVIIDVNKERMQEFVDSLDIADNSITAFITAGGKELVSENLKEGSKSAITGMDKVFCGQSFYEEVVADEENLFGVKDVKFAGKNYIFFYSKCSDNGGMIASLVPLNVVTGQADAIKSMTVALVVLATIIASIVGMIIVAGIQKNMKNISKTFGEVAKGDLTLSVGATGHDEFVSLAGSATNMIHNTKNLVMKVNNATEELEASSNEVNKASGVLSEYSQIITESIAEINVGMAKETDYAQECVTKADLLSDEIQKVVASVATVQTMIDETVVMINNGIDIINNLGKRADETSLITSKVGESIEELQKKTEIINEFTRTIEDITEETNLLSLNASIEAARAGDAGRGFSVVAEEIRKLADDTGDAASEISNNVKNIIAQTGATVQTANQAREMVSLQTEAVTEVINVFENMKKQMDILVEGLGVISECIEAADDKRTESVDAVQNISAIIEETTANAVSVNSIADKLMESVDNLNQTADSLGSNMDELKNEISVFKI